MIVGAGLAGMLAAFVFPDQEVYESHDPEWVEHQALLRFRSSAVADLTGIPFRQVTVHKGIWDNGWVQPNVASCNRYSQKVLGRVEPRSIWDISTVERWVAPLDLRARMKGILGTRIHWNTTVDLDALLGERGNHPVISTIPLSVWAHALGVDGINFHHTPIQTTRVTLVGVDVHQTVYFPNHAHALYRASITGDVLTMEWLSAPHEIRSGLPIAAREAEEAFGIGGLAAAVSSSGSSFHSQQFGKIAPVDESVRRGLLLRLTKECGVYSLGRFATWRNILLDDVVHDAAVIKRMMYEADDYDRALGAH